MAIAPRCRGFTYIGLIVLLAILGLVGAAGMKTGSLMQRAAAEQELLEIGAEFSAALRSYAAATPKGQPQQPPDLAALLKDPRFPQVRRHLRKVFVDPLTGRAEWGLSTAGDQGGIIGVYSLSPLKPLKVGNFDARFANFDNKERISDWKFTAAGQGVIASSRPGEPAAPPVTGSQPPAAPVMPANTPEPPQAPEPPTPATPEPAPMPELAVEPAAAEQGAATGKDTEASEEDENEKEEKKDPPRQVVK